MVLLHYPAKNKTGETIHTSITTMDLHDMSRTCKTYGVEKFYVVQPDPKQHRFAENVCAFWRQDKARAYQPDRAEALALVDVKFQFEEVLKEVQETYQKRPLLIATAARKGMGKRVSFAKIKEMSQEERPIIYLFGTGWGIAEDFLADCDGILAPILGKSEYNHLSVRSACAIIMDRIYGNMESDNSGDY